MIQMSADKGIAVIEVRGTPILMDIQETIVIGSDLDYGIGRMWEGYAAIDASQERHLFRSIEEVTKWLES